MDKNQAKLMKSNKLRLVKNNMGDLSSRRNEAYEKNRGAIDENIKKMVNKICLSESIDPDAFTKTVHHVIDSLFYKRPSKKVIVFLDNISNYPGVVIYEAMLRYSMYLVDSGKKKKCSTSYFLGFLRNQLFEFRNKKQTTVKRKLTEDLPDDL